MFQCPQTAGLKPRTGIVDYGQRDYGINSRLGGSPAAGPRIPRTRFLTSRKFWFGDDSFTINGGQGWWATGSLHGLVSTNTCPWTWGWRSQSGGIPHSIPGHPRGIANFVYGDLHASSLAERDVARMSADEFLKLTGSDTE